MPGEAIPQTNEAHHAQSLFARHISKRRAFTAH